MSYILDALRRAEAQRQQLRQAVIERKHTRVQILNRGKHDNVYWMDVDLQPLYNGDTFVGFVAMETDITELVTRQEQLGALLENLPVGLVLLDAQHQIRELNTEAKRILVRDEGESLGDAMAQVIELRQLYIPPTSSQCDNQAMDITEPGWWQGLSVHQRHSRQPVLVVCEGVLMYLQPFKVNRIIREICENAPEGSELVLDFISPLAVGPNAMLKQQEAPDAPFTWGVHNGHEITHLHPRLELLSQHSVSEAYGLGVHWAEMCWHLFTGGPLYGMARFRIS